MRLTLPSEGVWPVFSGLLFDCACFFVGLQSLQLPTEAKSSTSLIRGDISIYYYFIFILFILVLFSINFLFFLIFSLEKVIIFSLYFTFFLVTLILVDESLCFLKLYFGSNTYWCSIFEYSITSSLSPFYSFGLIFV